jgi:hypothetical protein
LPAVCATVAASASPAAIASLTMRVRAGRHQRLVELAG